MTHSAAEAGAGMLGKRKLRLVDHFPSDSDDMLLKKTPMSDSVNFDSHAGTTYACCVGLGMFLTHKYC